MLRVSVVGAGPAGISAAREASVNGASVTLVDSSTRIPVPRSRWPLALRRRPSSEASAPGGSSLTGLDVRLGETVKSVGRGSLEVQGGGRVRFDTCVLATGSVPTLPTFPGRNKPGVFLLDSEHAYVELGRTLGEFSRPVVCGRTIGALVAAEVIAERSSAVSVYLDEDSEVASMGPVTRQTLLRAAAGHGVSVSFGRVERALGVLRLEAVVVDGEVSACDALIAVPGLRPNTSAAFLPKGRSGGYAVDPTLSTGITGVYSAGSCAELDDGTGRPGVLDESPNASGRVAGANASGSRLIFWAPRQRQSTLFGLKLLRWGLTLDSASSMGFDVAIESGTEGDHASCSMVYDRKSGRVLGMDALVPATGSGPGSFLLPDRRADLASVAYGQWEGATDISVITETARQGLRAWRRC